MLWIIVATGNHFVFDAVAGGAVVVAGWLLARLVVDRTRATRSGSVAAWAAGARA
jgi:hypothetical protein